jgi:TrmH family RNA methyltransferase
MGALARVRVHYVDLSQWLADGLGRRESGASSYPIYGTLLDGRNMYEEGVIPNKAQGIIIMGNEGNGISEEVRRFITHPLYIPSYKQSEGEVVESLNVSIATAIILAEFRR